MDSNRDEGDKGGGVNTAPAYPLFIIPCIPFIPVKALLFVCLTGMEGMESVFRFVIHQNPGLICLWLSRVPARVSEYRGVGVIGNR